MSLLLSSAIALPSDTNALWPIEGPISSLPPELLIEIFVWCGVGDPLAPLPLRTVSKWWRAIIRTSPRIWENIVLDDQDHSVPFLHTQAQLWAQQSLPLLFNVKLKVQSPDLILPMLSPLLPSIGRWRSFVMQGHREEALTTPTDFPMTDRSLDYLRIYLQNTVDDSRKNTFVQEWPRYIMRLWLFELPKAHLLVPMRFTTIKITEDSFSDMHCHPEDILDFLSACPELIAFYFKGWQHIDDPPAKPLPVVSLPNLETLQVKNTCMARSILSYLYTPRLLNLYLAHLNVEFTLRGDYSEAGDSDDDAQDFSQSPSSDHATGMGLRRLLDRSNPPLMLLDMDFSDMRTKDFKYIFDRLPNLRDFLIVASDMSDTVIQLLRPYTIANKVGAVNIRLPLLRTIALYNCQRLTGNAIVDALTARVNHTDTRPAGTDTLAEVSIVTCDGFKHEHAQTLAKPLGSRLRLS